MKNGSGQGDALPLPSGEPAAHGADDALVALGKIVFDELVGKGLFGGLDDVLRCRDAGCAGVIIGKAWYEGRIDLTEALAAAKEK